MGNVISALINAESGLTEAKLLGVLTEMVPYLVMIIPVALGVYFFRKLIRGTAKAKVRM